MSCPECGGICDHDYHRRNNSNLTDLAVYMTEVMGCGHTLSSVVSSGEGTSYCAKCADGEPPDDLALAEKRASMLLELLREVQSSTDTERQWSPYLRTRVRMVLDRPTN